MQSRLYSCLEDKEVREEGVDDEVIYKGKGEEFGQEGVDGEVNYKGEKEEFGQEGVDSEVVYKGVEEEFGQEGVDGELIYNGEEDESEPERVDGEVSEEEENEEFREEDVDGEFSDEGNDCHGIYSRQKKECPLPGCDAKVVHLPRHLRTVHGWTKEYARTAASRFRLRKAYVFSNETMARAGNRKTRKTCVKSERCTQKKPCRRIKLCPVPGCQTTTDRLPQHLQRKHKLKRDCTKYKKALSLAKIMARTKPHVFLQMKKERKIQLKEERKNHLASAMSQNEDYGKESDDAGDAVCMDGLVHGEGHNEAGKEGEDSDVIVDNEVTETANLAIKVLTEFRKWLISPDGEKKDVKTAKQHAAQLKNILSIVGGGTRLESLLDAKTIRDVFLGEHALENIHLPQ